MRRFLTSVRTGSLILAVVLLAVLLIQPAPANAADWPDLEKIDGTIENYVLPLVDGPNINGGNDQIYLHWTCTYHDGYDDWRDVYLRISYYPDPSKLSGGTLEASISTLKKYGDRGPRVDSNPTWREEHQASDTYQEIEWLNTAERFSFLYRLDDRTIPWNGLKLDTYKDHYIIEIIGEGNAWHTESEFKQAMDMAEDYAKSSIDMLAGGLSLKHYDPFTYLTAGGGYDHRPAGDLIATLTGEGGKPVKNQSVVFYVEPGSTLEKVMLNGAASSWITADLLGSDPVILGDDVTDKNGQAYLNYLWPNLIDPGKFASTMQEQRYLHDEEGVISGKVYAVTVDTDKMKVTNRASVDVSFAGIARIVKITGNGRTDEFKHAYLTQYPDAPSWGTGKVRVKRSFAYPTFDYSPVEEGFILQTGDIIDIDGDVTVEIVWITGDRAIARVPDKVVFGDTEIRTPHSRLILSTSSYDSGFQSNWDKIESAVLGFSAGQGLDVLSGVHPLATGVKKGGEFVISLYDALKEVDFTNQNLITKIRVRSVVRTDTTGEETVIQTFEGSPTVLTSDGTAVTLGVREMVSIGADGSAGAVETFDDGDTPEWSATAAAWVDSSAVSGETSGDDESGGISIGIIIAIVAAAAVVIIGGVFVLSRKKR